MEMNDLPPYEYNLFYSGWNRKEDPLTIDSVIGIHHPRGDIKKFSWSTDSLQVWGYGSSNQGFNTHWRVKSWDAGTTTEGGSSGSPLMDQQGRIIGQLHGGQAACGNTLPDWYGRFSVSWEGDSISARQLRVWLDPDSLSPEAIDGYQPVYYLIESSVGPNGGGSIDSSFYVMENRSHTFHIVPEINWFIEDVLVNGVSVGAIESYTFENVISEHTIQAFFAPDSYTITATAGENGSIDPAGEIEVEQGSSQTFTIIPNEGFLVEDVLVDGESVGAATAYTFENITSDHTIHALFVMTTWSVTFIVVDEEEQLIPDAVITFDGEVNDPGQYYFEGLVPDDYDFEVAREGYFPYSGTVTINFENVQLTVTLEIDDTRINALQHTDKIRVYPNPARETLTIEGPATIEKIQILGTTGAIIANQYFTDETVMLSVARLQPGIYLLRIFTQGEIIHRKIQIIP
jgi:hypothetical protein